MRNGFFSSLVILAGCAFLSGVAQANEPPVCRQLAALPPDKDPPQQLIDAAMLEGHKNPTCLATVAIRQLNRADNCAVAEHAAERAAKLAPGDPYTELARGTVRSCKLAAWAATADRGLPVFCPREELVSIAYEIGHGAMLSERPDAERVVIQQIEQDLALYCRDDEGVLAATVSALATVAGVPSTGARMMHEFPGAPWKLTGAMLQHGFMRFIQSGNPGPGGLSVLHERARAWLIGALRGTRDPFHLVGPQLVARALLKADDMRGMNLLSVGRTIDDIALLERGGALHQKLVLDTAAAVMPTRLAFAPLPAATLAELSELTTRLVPYGDKPRGSLLLLKARLILAIRETEADSCRKSQGIAAAFADFSGTGALMLPFEHWQEVVRDGANAGLGAAQECQNQVVNLHEFQRIAQEIDSGAAPWMPNVFVNNP